MCVFAYLLLRNRSRLCGAAVRTSAAERRQESSEKGYGPHGTEGHIEAVLRALPQTYPHSEAYCALPGPGKSLWCRSSRV